MVVSRRATSFVGAKGAKRKLSMTSDEGGDIAKNSTACSATTAVSASSFLREVTSSAVGSSAAIQELKKSAPPPGPLPPKPAAKPPGLPVKVKTGRSLQASTVNAAVLVGLPCRFTLRRKRQTQEHRNSSNDDDGRRATMTYTSSTSSSHRRRPLLRRVVIGTKPGNAVGYPPRLRKMGAAFSTEDGETTIDFFVGPSSRTSLQGVTSRGASATTAGCGAAVSTLCTAASPFGLAPSAHQGRITPCGGCFHVDDAGAVAKSNADFGGGKARTHEAPHIGHIAIQEHRLCGRLRKGTTVAPPPKLVVSRHDRGGTGGVDTITRPPRTLFLVSGQPQQLPVDASGARQFSTGNKMAPLQGRSQTRRCERSHFPPGASLASATGGRAKTVPAGGVRESRSGRWNWDRVIRVSGDDDHSIERDVEVSLPESTSGPANKEELCDAASVEATAGEGLVSSGKRVLHVRVPRPPPISRLLLRPAPPRNSALRKLL